MISNFSKKIRKMASKVNTAASEIIAASKGSQKFA